MPGDSDSPPVIIIKKKVAAAGHHGGAWKVAYADFVTALMALFIVLWLLNAKQEVREAVSGYFNDPRGYAKQTGTGQAGSGNGLELSKENIGDLKDRIEQAMREMPQFQAMKDQVDLTVTGEGLRIELLETENGMFFESGSPSPSPNARELLTRLAKELGKLHNEIVVEGHTDARPYTGRQDYTNWELSTDRANAARHIMQSAGLAASQVKQVRGFADQQLRKPEAPTDASNRRVTIIVQFANQAPGKAPMPGEQKPAAEPQKPEQNQHQPEPKSQPEPQKPTASAPWKGGNPLSVSLCIWYDFTQLGTSSRNSTFLRLSGADGPLMRMFNRDGVRS